MVRRFYLIFSLLLTACVFQKTEYGVWIKNKQDEKLYVHVDGLENAKYHKLVFIQHGLAANMEHQVVETAKKAFLDKNYVVVTFDSRYSLGNSGNDVLKARITTFEEDLTAVIDWAKTQPFYSEPFALSGHSMGGYSTLKYSAINNDKINILVPITPLVSGSLWEKSCMHNMTAFCLNWKETGFYKYSDSKTNKTATIPYKIITDSQKEDAFTFASKIKAKTLLIGAENDIVIDIKDLSKLKKEIAKSNFSGIASSGHNFENQQDQTDLYNAIVNFLP